jgi:mannose/fructose-specific phosphotransferase system component IIA
VFVDMASGSCLFAVLRKLRARDDIRVVTGVNLAMLLDFVFHREGTAADAAVRAADVGGKAIGVSA